MLFDKFPREMAFPFRSGQYRMVYDQQQFNEAVNKLNGKKNVYTTIYSYRRLTTNHKNVVCPDYSSVRIDKLYFDFDTKHCFDNIKKIHKYLLEKKIMHVMFFSGGGFHLYIFCEEARHLFPKDVIENAQRYFADKVKLTIGDPNNEVRENPILGKDNKPVIFDIDTTSIGDWSRISRVPHTYNLKRKRWCITITHKDLIEKSYKEIQEIANSNKRLGNTPTLYGTIKVNLRKFDFKVPEKKEVEQQNIPLLGESKHISEEKFWLCIENMIVKRSGCYAWYWAIIWFRDKGYTKKETDSCLKKYLSKFKRTDGTNNDYWHCKNIDRQLDIVYNDKTNKHFFPSANHLFRKGYCPGRCKNFKENNCLYYNGEIEQYKEEKK